MRTLFNIDRRITIGELITVLSIVFSAISVMITWRNEQKIKMRENATRARVEIAKTLNTINQVIQIQLSFYELIEEDIVETSRIAVVERDAVKSRDFMWEKFYKHRAEILNILAQRDWEVAYTNLLTSGITADSLYIKTINRLKGLQENQFNLARTAFEKELLEFKPTADRQTSMLIDKLRKLKITHRANHLEYAQIATEELNTYCLDLIRETDKELLFKSD